MNIQLNFGLYLITFTHSERLCDYMQFYVIFGVYSWYVVGFDVLGVISDLEDRIWRENTGIGAFGMSLGTFGKPSYVTCISRPRDESPSYK